MDRISPLSLTFYKTDRIAVRAVTFSLRQFSTICPEIFPVGDFALPPSNPSSRKSPSTLRPADETSLLSLACLMYDSVPSPWASSWSGTRFLDYHGY